MLWEIDQLKRLHASMGGVVTPEFIKNITSDMQNDLDVERLWYNRWGIRRLDRRQSVTDWGGIIPQGHSFVD